MKKQRLLVLVLTMVFSIGLLSMQAYAAPKKAAAAKEPFDAVFYAQMYPDVVAVLGSKADALYKHYINYGKAEGRMATADAFDPVYYAQANPDVVAVLGNKADALYKHYINHGKAEGRKANLNGTAAVPIAPVTPTDSNAVASVKEIKDWIASGKWDIVNKLEAGHTFYGMLLENNKDGAKAAKKLAEINLGPPKSSTLDHPFVFDWNLGVATYEGISIMIEHQHWNESGRFVYERWIIPMVE